MARLQLAYFWLMAQATTTKERMKEDAGEGPVSYIAVILLIALIVAAIVKLNIGDTIAGGIVTAVKKVFSNGGAS